MKAACSALTDDVRNGEAMEACDQFSKGYCVPGSQGDRECGSAAALQAADRSVCVETDDEKGYTYA